MTNKEALPRKGEKCDWLADRIDDECQAPATHTVDLGDDRPAWTSRETRARRMEPRYRARCREHLCRDLFEDLGAVIRPIR